MGHKYSSNDCKKSGCADSSEKNGFYSIMIENPNSPVPSERDNYQASEIQNTNKQNQYTGGATSIISINTSNTIDVIPTK
jgi:hypothetical protein